MLIGRVASVFGWYREGTVIRVGYGRSQGYFSSFYEGGASNMNDSQAGLDVFIITYLS